MFVVEYTLNVLHAVDGMQLGLVMVPVNGNFLFKVYSEARGESYRPVVLALLELQQMMLQATSVSATAATNVVGSGSAV